MPGEPGSGGVSGSSAPAETAVSIIVAVLDSRDTLQRCLDSIVAQSQPSKQLIVVDGGSTDGTLEVIKANESRISHWETGLDRGIYSAWNKALRHATGRWVCFVGADDYFLDPASLRDLVELGDREGADLVCGRVWYVDQHGERQFTLGQPWDWRRMKRSHAVAHTGMLHGADLFDRYGPFREDLRIAGDYEFLLRLGPAVTAAFLDRVYLAMGNRGVSSSNAVEALREVRGVQAAHSQIGRAAAWGSYLRSLSVHLYWAARRTADRTRVVAAMKTIRKA